MTEGTERTSQNRAASAIRVVAVDDHPSYAHGLRALFEALSEEVRVVAVGTTVEEGLALVEQHLPDVALLDVRMPAREGIEVARKIRELFPSVKAVMLTASDSPQDVMDSLRLGVRGYLTKEIRPEELISALKTVMAGDLVLAPLAASLLLEENRAFLPLTDTEVHILSLLGEGIDLPRIAKEVLMSESGLKRAIRGIQRKLGADNRMQAVVAAAKRGLI